MTSAQVVKREVSRYSVLLHQMGWVANHDGNVSARNAGSDRFFITPTATSKRLCTPESIVECKLDGAPVSRGKPPSEVALHTGAYRARADAAAVIHAHPPYATAFSIAHVELGPIAIPEIVVSLGDRVPLVRLLLPKDPETAAIAGAALGEADVVLLAGNGVLAIGDDLEQAYLRVELVEHYARILAIARGGVGQPVALDASAKERLLDARRKAGLGPKVRPPKASSAEPEGRGARPQAPREPATSTRVRAVVTEEVRRALGVEK